MNNVEEIIKQIEWAEEMEMIVYDFTDCFALMRKMQDAMETFVKRVEGGTIRSKRTYAQFKEILSGE